MTSYIEKLKKLQEDIVRLGPVPFYGLMLFVSVIAMILADVSLLATAAVSGYVGWTVADRIMAT